MLTNTWAIADMCDRIHFPKNRDRWGLFPQPLELNFKDWRN